MTRKPSGRVTVPPCRRRTGAYGKALPHLFTSRFLLTNSGQVLAHHELCSWCGRVGSRLARGSIPGG